MTRQGNRRDTDNRHKLLAAVPAILTAWISTASVASEPALKLETESGDTLHLNRATVSNVELYQQQDAGVVCFEFSDEARKAFETMTRENVGLPIEVKLGERVINAPVVREPIVGGKGCFNFDKATAEAVAKAMESE